MLCQSAKIIIKSNFLVVQFQSQFYFYTISFIFIWIFCHVWFTKILKLHKLSRWRQISSGFTLATFSRPIQFYLFQCTVCLCKAIHIFLCFHFGCKLLIIRAFITQKITITLRKIATSRTSLATATAIVLQRQKNC